LLPQGAAGDFVLPHHLERVVGSSLVKKPSCKSDTV
jgi:hypothetical protein